VVVSVVTGWGFLGQGPGEKEKKGNRGIEREMRRSVDTGGYREVLEGTNSLVKMLMKGNLKSIEGSIRFISEKNFLALVKAGLREVWPPDLKGLNAREHIGGN